MCVIIAKAKGTACPDVLIIRKAMQANPDGFGIAWINRGKLEIFRTMSADEMEKYYYANFDKLEASAFVFHARWATHGTKTISNCHGWKCLNGKRAFFHNGVLDIAARDNMTDSETFLRDIYEPIADKCGDEAAERAINAVIGNSKFAFIDNRGSVKLYGRYIEKNGIFFSNLNFVNSYHTGHVERYYNPFARYYK